jgi:cell division protease FtsH
MMQMDFFYDASPAAPLGPATSYLDLPLPPGGRPLFGAKSFLETIGRHHQWRHPGAALDAWEMQRWVMTMRALAHAIHTATPDERGPLVQMNLWQALPLFMDAGMVLHWEREHPWKTDYMDYSGETQAYLDLLEGPTPSDAYRVTATHPQQGLCQRLWSTWLTSAPAEVLISLLETSAQHWEAWLERQPEHRQTLRDGLRPFLDMGSSEALNLTPIQALAWGLWEHWAFQADEAQGDLLYQLWSMHRWALSPLMALMAHSMGVLATDVGELLSDASPLMTGISVYKPLTSGPPRAFAKISAWSQASDTWCTSGWKRVQAHLARGNDGRWASLFPEGRVEKPDPEAAARWAHLQGEFEQATRALAHPDCPPAILIVGGAGQGKTLLAQDLLATTGRHPGGAHLTHRYHSTGLEAVLQWARVAVDAAQHGLLLLDSHNHPWHTSVPLAWVLHERRLPVIATATKLDEVSATLRAKFDQVIVLSDMPLAARLPLAKAHFPHHPDLALRVARTLRSAQAIVWAAAWCEQVNQWDWATVQAHRLREEQAKGGTGGRFEFSAQVAEADLPPMAGYEHLTPVVDRLCRAFLEPERYAAMGVSPPRGAILMGPPGTGKTLFARHLAARLQIPCLAPSVVEMRKEPSQIRALFAQARAQAPCLVLLDEAQPLLDPFSPCVQALLTELDGVEPLDGVLVIATTNFTPIHPALLRPGRLHEFHRIGLPDQQDRERIWAAYLAHRPTEPTDASWWPVLARASRSLSGAEIAEAVSRAAGDAVAANETTLTLQRLVQACDAMAWSAPNGRSPADTQERWMTSVHEAGHALLAWRHDLEVDRITVRPRQNTLGMVSWNYPETKLSYTRSELHGRVQMSLGGILAEQVIAGEYSQGGSSDLMAVERDLRMAISELGFGSLGPVAAGFQPHWSERRRQQIERETEQWARAAFDEGLTWLVTHRDLLEGLAHDLMAEWDLSGVHLDAWRERVVATRGPAPRAPLIQLMEGAEPIGGLGRTLLGDEPAPRPAEQRLHQNEGFRPGVEHG